MIPEKTVSNYQPFSAVQSEEGSSEAADSRAPRIKHLYDTYATARDREERGITEKRDKPDKPRQGNTIFVSGHKISEEFLKKHFQTIGNIINVSMEIEKKYSTLKFDIVSMIKPSFLSVEVSSHLIK